MHWAERKAMGRRGRIACAEKKIRRGERKRKNDKGIEGGAASTKHEVQSQL